MRAIDFPFQFRNGQLKTTTSYPEIVRNQIIDSVMTNYRERVMRPNYGADILSLLFDPADELRNSDVSVLIQERLSYMCPRAIIDKVTISTHVIQTGVVLITVSYRLNSYDDTEDLTIPIEVPSNE